MININELHLGNAIEIDNQIRIVSSVGNVSVPWFRVNEENSQIPESLKLISKDIKIHRIKGISITKEILIKLNFSFSKADNRFYHKNGFNFTFREYSNGSELIEVHLDKRLCYTVHTLQNYFYASTLTKLDVSKIVSTPPQLTNSDKILLDLDTVRRREELIAFLMTIDEVYGMHVREDAEKCVDDYLKSN